MDIMWIAVLVFIISLVGIIVTIVTTTTASTDSPLDMNEYRFGNFWFSVDYLEIFNTIRTYSQKVHKVVRKYLVTHFHATTEKLHKVSKKHIERLSD